MRSTPQAACQQSWDTIVVGAGALGIVVAVSLARAGQQVLLIESGGELPSMAAQKQNEAQVVGRRHHGITEGRARVVGGTTTLWGGQLTQFTKRDLDGKGEDGARRWPIEYESLLPWYRECAALLGLDQDLMSDAQVDAATARQRLSRADAETLYSRWLSEPNFATCFKSELDGNARLSLLPEINVRGLLIGDHDDRVAGVSAANGARQNFEFRARRVVLANGTVEISRLLLLTANAQPQLAWAANRNIGAFFQDHIDCELGRVEKGDFRALLRQFENFTIGGKKYQPKLKIADGVASQESLLNIAASLRFDSKFADDIAVLKTLVRSVKRGRGLEDITLKAIMAMLMQIRLVLPIAWNYLRHRRISALTDGGVTFIAHCEQSPLRESRISLSGSRVDSFGDPIPVLDWKINEGEQLRVLRRFAGILDAVLHEEFSLNFTPNPHLMDDDAMLAQGRDSYHQCGGAIMSKSMVDGVVDSDCRVHGTSNLYLAGAAVFPSASHANPTFTAMALALRLSHFLAQTSNDPDV